MQDHTNRSLIIVMIIILIIILLLVFVPHGLYYVSPRTTTIERTVPVRTAPVVETHTYTTTTPVTTYQQQTTTTTTTEHTVGQ